MSKERGKKEYVPYFCADRRAAARPSREERWLPPDGLEDLFGSYIGMTFTTKLYDELETLLTSCLYQALLEQHNSTGLFL